MPGIAGLMRLQASAGNLAVGSLIAGHGRHGTDGPGMLLMAVQRAGGRYWQAPEWGRYSKVSGGTFMKVRLGPDAGDSTLRGSVPRRNACSRVNRLNAEHFGGYRWIKGHLLNENLGGPGESENLTPLTATANSDHKNSFEAPIKSALTWTKARSLYSRGDQKWYGVYYEVSVQGREWARGVPNYARSVASRLDCRAVWIERDKTTGAIARAARPAGAPRLPNGRQPIYCVQ
jgi:hypothetical protein